MVPHEINAESAIFVSESMAALQNMINVETVTLEGLQSESLSDTRHPRHMRARRRPGPAGSGFWNEDESGERREKIKFGAVVEST